MSSLEGIYCNNNPELRILPEDMSRLSFLVCTGCFNLTSLPGGMSSLKNLHCSNCPGLQSLPDYMSSLIELQCGGCHEFIIPSKFLRCKIFPFLVTDGYAYLDESKNGLIIRYDYILNDLVKALTLKKELLLQNNFVEISCSHETDRSIFEYENLKQQLEQMKIAKNDFGEVKNLGEILGEELEIHKNIILLLAGIVDGREYGDTEKIDMTIEMLEAFEELFKKLEKKRGSGREVLELLMSMMEVEPSVERN